MNRFALASCAFLGLTGLAPMALAQIEKDPEILPVPNDDADDAPCRFSQPWQQPRASIRSRVLNCQNPLPRDRAAFDDFKSCMDGFARRLVWWGAILDPAQLNNRPYYISIRLDDGNCHPGALIYEQCVTPQAFFVGVDCNNLPVYRFQAIIPPCPVAKDGHYWLEIAENDMLSANFGQDDFRWSSRRPVRGCNAVQRDVEGFWIDPLLDNCDGAVVDLSFEVRFFAN